MVQKVKKLVDKMQNMERGWSILQFQPPEVIEMILGKVSDFADIHRLLTVCRTVSRSTQDACFKKVKKIQIKTDGRKGTFKPYVIPLLKVVFWSRRLSRDVRSFRDHSHGTACGSSAAMTVPQTRSSLPGFVS